LVMVTVLMALLGMLQGQQDGVFCGCAAAS
jgi:hypothetical protein